MKILFHVLVGAALLLGIELFFLLSGGLNIAASKPHPPALAWLLQEIKLTSITNRSRSLQAPALQNPEMILKGRQNYNRTCIGCHGAPGIDRNIIGNNISPKPSNLVEVSQKYSAEELFWIVKNGIKMTGMPTFEKIYSEKQIWELVAFIKNLPNYSANEYRKFFQEQRSIQKN